MHHATGYVLDGHGRIVRRTGSLVGRIDAGELERLGIYHRPARCALLWQLMRRLAVVVVVVAGAASALTVWYRTTYTNWPWQDDPQRLSWCDRSYERTDVLETRDELRGQQLVAVLRAPPVIGSEAFVSADERTDAENGTRCPTGLHLRAGGGYRAYVLLGGP